MTEQPQQSLQEQIDAKFAEMQARLEAAEKRAADAEARAEAATVQSATPLNLVPEDAGGPGTDIAQTWYPHSPGRAFFERKVTEGKTKKEAVRALKRRIADAAYQQLHVDAHTPTGPGGQPGTTLQSSVTGLAPRQPALRISHSRAHTNARTRRTPATTPTSSRARTPSTKPS